MTKDTTKEEADIPRAKHLNLKDKFVVTSLMITLKGAIELHYILGLELQNYLNLNNKEI